MVHLLAVRGILVSIILASNVKGELMESLMTCCTVGKEESTKKSSCENISSVMSALQVRPQSRNICNFIGVVCCENEQRNLDCSNGMEAARTTGICSTQHSNDHQKCCDLCKIGMRIGSQAEDCELGSARFGELWEAAFFQCCQVANPTATDQTYYSDSEQDPEPESGNICELFSGELCSQGCTPIGQSYRCYCNPGYVLMADGKSCAQQLIDRCEGCSHTCENGAYGTICTCPSGFYLAPDNKTCIQEPETTTARWNCPNGYRQALNGTNICRDIDECYEGTSTCNRNIQRCVNTIGSYKCISTVSRQKCNRGYRFNQDSGVCEDVDECADIEDPPCDSNQDCENTSGSFICRCKIGFKQDPITLACMDINECQMMMHDCGQFQRCDNTMGSYTCVRDVNCGTGYTLNSESGKCEDDDECLLGTHHCGLLGSGWECRNTQGSFRCVRSSHHATTTAITPTTAYCSSPDCRTVSKQCPAGFKPSGSFCVDINECTEGIARCQPNQKCVNIKGHYLCSSVVACKEGFRLNPEGTKCIDINECEEQRSLCHHHCDNRYGSYRCRCNPGYAIGPDNRTCIDINECAQGSRCQGYCHNELGTYRCECPPGYKLTADRHSCIDLNECEQGNLCQETEEVCVNIPGSHRCGSLACPPGYRRDINRKSRCYKGLRCAWRDEDCIRQPETYSFNFISMVSNHTIPSSGYINLFVVETVSSSIVPDFTFDVVQARVPPSVEAATRSSFNLNKQYGRATLQLVKTLFGPQDIQIELKTEFYVNQIFQAANLHTIDIYVSQYEF